MCSSDLAREFPLDNQENVIHLLETFHKIGANEAIAILLTRGPENQVVLTGLPLMRDNTLADVLRELGASNAAERLVRRQADAGFYSDAFTELVRQLPKGHAAQQLRRFGREPDSSPSPAWTWDNH